MVLSLDAEFDRLSLYHVCVVCDVTSPMYIDSTNNDPLDGDTTVGDDLIASFEPLMLRYRVDAAFWGHHHSSASC